MKIRNYINIFLFYSVFGNIFERICMYFIDRSYISGFMGSIFTPIYGVAFLLILFIHNRININNKWGKILVEFFIYMIVLTLLEYLGAILIENIFNKVFWNYDKFKYNIGIYVSLETSLLWSVLSILVLYLNHPLFIKFERYIPTLVTIIVSLVFVINLFIVLV